MLFLINITIYGQTLLRVCASVLSTGRPFSQRMASLLQCDERKYLSMQYRHCMVCSSQKQARIDHFLNRSTVSSLFVCSRVLHSIMDDTMHLSSPGSMIKLPSNIYGPPHDSLCTQARQHFASQHTWQSLVSLYIGSIVHPSVRPPSSSSNRGLAVQCDRRTPPGT